MMRSYLGVILAIVVLAIALSACGSNPSSSSKSNAVFSNDFVEVDVFDLPDRTLCVVAYSPYSYDAVSVSCDWGARR